MLLSALRRRSFPAWVGIFAILTIFVAPVISQTQVLHEHGHHTPTTTANHTAPHDSTAPASHSNNIAEQPHNHTEHAMPGHHAAPSSPASSSPPMMMDHAACGYCVLFSYTPALFTTGAIHPILTASLSEALVVLFLSRIVLPERYASPVVRAPPFE